ncbi:MAG: alpha/beta hydrolase domain-containing protein [Actinomycetota bacterium]
MQLRRTGSALFLGLLVAGASVGVTAGAAPAASGASGASEAVPTVTGPVTGGKGTPNLTAPTLPPDAGYVIEEFLIAGEATAYTSAVPLTSDGEWTVEPASTAPYKTRLYVARPADPKDFNGTVFVEWLNVSAGFDTAASWNMAHIGLLREGTAYVGVSAQSVGVQGSGAATVTGGLPGGGLKAADPERYGSLVHPGDSYSYDIFSQAGRAVRGDGAVKPLGDLKVKRVIASGESQSAGRMVTYIDAVHPIAREYDGFLIHSRFHNGAPLSQAPLADIPTPTPTFVRTDVSVPVLVFQTESDIGPLGGGASVQRDTKRVRTWHVAGTAHYDAYGVGPGFADPGDGSAERTLLDVSTATFGPLNCAAPINAGPQYAVLMAGMTGLDRWVRTGTPPASSPRFEFTTGTPTVGNDGNPRPTFTLTRDDDGNVIGGIRTPFVDAPRARIDGEPGQGPSFCRLFGNTVPFSAATLDARYGSRAKFLAAFDAATKRAVTRGYVLPEEAKKWKQAIREVPYAGS